MVQDGEPELKRPRVDPPAAEAEAEVPAATEVGAPLLTADAAEGSPAVDSATTTSASADAASASADTASASADTAEAPAAVGQEMGKPAYPAKRLRCQLTGVRVR